MKMINKLFILLLIVTTISSCKKDEDNDGPSKLDVPELLIPSNNSIASYGNINFNWSDVNLAKEYAFQLAKDSSFSVIIDDYVGVFSEYTYEDIFNLEVATDYYWRVKAIAADIENSEYTEAFKFSYIRSPSDILLYTNDPDYGEEVSFYSGINFYWTVTGDESLIDHYSVRILEEYNFSGTYVEVHSENSNYDFITIDASVFQRYTNYKWSVTAYLLDGSSVSSEESLFSTLTGPASPKNGTYNGSGSGPVFISSVLDTTFTNLPMEITVQETFNGSGVFDVTYDFDVNGINVNPTVEGIESGSNIVITNQSYNLMGIVDLLINDNITFNGSNTAITGNAVLDNASGSSIIVNGNLSYSATK